MSIVLQKYNRILPCKLTIAESQSRGKELAAILGDIYSEEASQKNIKDQMKERLSELDARARRVQNVVNSGDEYRDVAVESRLMGADIVQVIRLDTNEVIETRPAREDELQLPLDPENPPHQDENWRKGICLDCINACPDIDSRPDGVDQTKKGRVRACPCYQVKTTEIDLVEEAGK
jgi:hypothetical protein